MKLKQREELAHLTDKSLLARLIWGEARGESTEGKVAVAWVVQNRVNADIGHDNKPDWWGEGVAGVILKPWQFSCLNENDPNLQKILALDEDHPDVIFAECLYAADVVLSGQAPDPTGGADSYHTKAVRPAWAAKARQTAVIGSHIFYKTIA